MVFLDPGWSAALDILSQGAEPVVYFPNELNGWKAAFVQIAHGTSASPDDLKSSWLSCQRTVEEHAMLGYAADRMTRMSKRVCLR